MQQEHASWLSRIQQEREDLKRDIDIQRTELLSSAKARQMEIESHLREKEEEFEQKKSKELEYINSENEIMNSKLEHARIELQKLEDERKEAILERERREQELSEMKNTIDALNKQREKLQEQRKLLHSDRVAITQQIQQLNELEELKIESENKQLSLRQCGRSKHGVENVKENGVHLSTDGDQNASPKKCSSPKLVLGKKLEVSPSVSTPISWVRKCAQVIFKRSPDKSADRDSDRSAHATLGNINDFSLVENGGLFACQMENGAGEVPHSVDGLKVGKKRLNQALSHDQSETLEPKQKQQRSSTLTQRVIGGEIDSNCPSVIEEKCSKNEHDAVPVGLSGKGLHYPRTGEVASSDDILFVDGKSDIPEDDVPSEETSLPAAEALNGDDAEDKSEPDEDSDDEGEEEEKASSAKKIWRFLIT
ncbi:unnamed protein product [Urochloa humidicola]